VRLALTLVSGLALVTPAFASPNPALPSDGADVPSYAFSFRGVSGCDDEQAFLKSFERRTQNVRLVSGDANGPVIIVIETRADHTYAELSIRLENGDVVHRSVEALSCAEAMEAIGFVASLALDPTALSPLRVAPPARTEAPRAPSPSSVPFDAEAQNGAAEPEAPLALLWALGAAPQISFGAAPSPLWGGSVAVELHLLSGVAWRSSLRLTLAHERSKAFETSAGDAHFERTLAALDLCPWRASLGNVSLTECAQLAAGALVAEGRATYAPTRSRTLWGEAGISMLLDVSLGPHIEWSTRGAFGVPWTRASFQFDDQVFFEVAPVVGSVNSGLVCRFR
jgi:hypothetical protein